MGRVKETGAIMKLIIAFLILLSVAVGFSRTLQDYLPGIVLAGAFVGSWIAFTTRGGPGGPWPRNDVRSERHTQDEYPLDVF